MDAGVIEFEIVVAGDKVDVVAGVEPATEGGEEGGVSDGDGVEAVGGFGFDVEARVGAVGFGQAEGVTGEDEGGGRGGRSGGAGERRFGRSRSAFVYRDGVVVEKGGEGVVSEKVFGGGPLAGAVLAGSEVEV